MLTTPAAPSSSKKGEKGQESQEEKGQLADFNLGREKEGDASQKTGCGERRGGIALLWFSQSDATMSSVATVDVQTDHGGLGTEAGPRFPQQKQLATCFLRFSPFPADPLLSPSIQPSWHRAGWLGPDGLLRSLPPSLSFPGTLRPSNGVST